MSDKYQIYLMVCRDSKDEGVRPHTEHALIQISERDLSDPKKVDEQIVYLESKNLKWEPIKHKGSAFLFAEHALFLLGGGTSSSNGITLINDVDFYFTFTQSGWRKCPSMIIERLFPQAVYVDNKVYVFGGVRADDGPWAEVFDIKSLKWSVLNCFPRNISMRSMGEPCCLLNVEGVKKILMYNDILQSLAAYDLITNELDESYGNRNELDDKVDITGGERLVVSGRLLFIVSFSGWWGFDVVTEMHCGKVSGLDQLFKGLRKYERFLVRVVSVGCTNGVHNILLFLRHFRTLTIERVDVAECEGKGLMATIVPLGGLRFEEEILPVHYHAVEMAAHKGPDLPWTRFASIVGLEGSGPSKRRKCRPNQRTRRAALKSALRSGQEDSKSKAQEAAAGNEKGHQMATLGID